MSELTEDVVREIVDEMVSDHLSYTDYVTDYDVRSMVDDSVNEYLAGGGGDVATYAEVCDLAEKVAKTEKEQGEQNFWKADRHHTHQDILDRLDNIEKRLRLAATGFPF